VTLPEALLTLRHARDSGDVPTAESVARALIDDYPHTQLALHAAGHALLSLGSLEMATTALEKALAVEVRAEIANDLGVTLQRRGEIERAIGAYRTALAVRPAFVEANSNLAAALFLTGAYVDALTHAQIAYKQSPGAPGLATTLALIEGALGGFDRTLERLDSFAPAATTDDPTALVARVYALRRLERPADAEPVALRLIELAPEAASFELLAICKRDLGQPGEALALLDTAIALSPNPAGPLAVAGETLLDMGDSAGARERFVRAAAANPDSVAVWVGLAQVTTFAPGDAALETMERLLHAPALAMREERIMLLFALGRAHLGAGNDARAFDFYAEGNRLRRASIAYDVADDERRMRAIADAFDAATLTRLAAGSAEPAPIVVMGMPRSGTSLVEQILASLPGVYGAGETPFLRETIEANAPYPALAASLTPARVARMGAAYAAKLGERTPPGLRAVDKMPSNFLYAGLLHAMLPGARLVFVTRDPLDNGLSLYTMLFAGRQDFAYDLAEIARYYGAHARLVAHWKAVLPPDAYVEIRYEDLVTDFDATVARLVAFCGLPWDDAVRRFYETPRRVATASRIEVRQPLYRTSVGRAQRYAPYLERLSAALPHGTRAR
jgi:tetratricopeptide (TPR) repeat protein